MKVKVSQKDGVAVVKINSDIPQEFSSLLENRLSELLDDGVARFIIDLEDASYLNSRGLAILLTMKKEAVKKGGDIILVKANYLIHNLLTITRIIKKVTLCQTVEEAEAILGSDHVRDQ